MKNDMETKNHKKPMIEYLDIDENFYIENDELKMRINESNGNDIGTWDDIWDGILKIIEKVREYDETHNTNK